MGFVDQDPYDARFEWGPEGAGVLSESCDAVVIVDVLRFSTVVSVWVERGATVFPQRWPDGSTAAITVSVGAAPGEDQGLTLSPT